MSVRRVFTGTHPVVFVTGNVGPVGPGEEFDVPADLAGRFDARQDVAVPRKRRARATETGGGDPGQAGETTSSTVSGGLADSAGTG